MICLSLNANVRSKAQRDIGQCAAEEQQGDRVTGWSYSVLTLQQTQIAS